LSANLVVMMDWRKLLSPQRFGHAEAEPGAAARSAFQKDWDRVVFSSAFRRLQDKTQVHSLPESDYVRTRLTHSMEVSSVGRSLGTAVGNTILQRQPHLSQFTTAADFGHIVSAACLAHDIGNPPFGHFGEDTIRFWFGNPRGGAPLIAGLKPAEQADFTGFEGNAQGFRILTRLQNWHDQGGLRLTAATLATFTKYPRQSTIDPTLASGDCAAGKFGIFQSDKEQFVQIAGATGLIEREAGGYWCRHPLAFLVEAADDICYRVVDLEDGFKLGRIRFEEAEVLLVALLGSAPPRYREIDDPPRKIAYLRAKAIGRLIDTVVQIFLDAESEIMAGELRQDLLSLVSQRDTLRDIAALTNDRIFQTRDRYQTEIGGGEVIVTLLEAFARAIEDCAQAGSGKPLAPKHEILIRLLPVPVKFEDPYVRMLQVTDFVSGMTDSYALNQFRRLKGLMRW
jgi:dGTPase